MATIAPISATEYLSSDQYEPDAEYVDGQIEQRSLGEFDHAVWQKVLLRWFLTHETEWNVRVLAELRVQVSPTRYRIPDVVVFDRSHPIEQILTRPPIAVFEVLSPEDRISRVLIKLADYARMGVPTIRVIEPATGEIFAYERGALTPIASTHEKLSDSLCFLDWTQIRELLDF